MTGWIFRAYPGPYKAYLDTPDGSPPTLLKTWDKKPTLREVSALVRSENSKRYGLTNDRYMMRRL
jgi:hypothetical protein